MSAERAHFILENESNVLLLDVRQRVKYLLGHIPGAHNIWRPAFQANEDDYPFSGMRADKAKMEKLLSRLGADSNTTILLYDDQTGADAARFWWILKLYGHDKVSLIDNGLKGWTQQNFPTQLKPPKTPAGNQFTFASKPHPQYLAELEQVKEATKGKSRLILDVRSQDEYSGKTRKSGAHRKGRIPGSIWLEYNQTLNDTGFLHTKELEELFNSAGVTKDKEIIIYCQSGVRSAHTLFVLTQLLGYRNVKNYDGSWIEWSWHKNLPLETGSSTVITKKDSTDTQLQ